MLRMFSTFLVSVLVVIFAVTTEAFSWMTLGDWYVEDLVTAVIEYSE